MQTKTSNGKILIISLLLCFVFPSCRVKYRNQCEYGFHDVPYRKMSLEFYRNGEVSLDNGNLLNYGFSSYGKWWVCGNDVVIQISSVKASDTLLKRDFPKQGDSINIERLLNDSTYTAFPDIYIDTVKFTHNGKTAYLKGFVFTHFDNTLRIKSLLRKHRKLSSAGKMK